MTKKELQDMAAKGYPDEFTRVYYDDNGEFTGYAPGDSLAMFVVIQIDETYDEEAEDTEQISQAVHVLQNGIRDLESTIRALMED